MSLFYHDGVNIPAAPYKDPESVIDYGSKYDGWLAPSEVIAISGYYVDGVLIQSNGQDVNGLVVDSTENNTTTTKAWLSGGVVGTSYTLTNRVTTSQGRTEDRSMIIMCQNK